MGLKMQEGKVTTMKITFSPPDMVVLGDKRTTI